MQRFFEELQAHKTIIENNRQIAEENRQIANDANKRALEARFESLVELNHQHNDKKTKSVRKAVEKLNTELFAQKLVDTEKTYDIDKKTLSEIINDVMEKYKLTKPEIPESDSDSEDEEGDAVLADAQGNASARTGVKKLKISQ